MENLLKKVEELLKNMEAFQKKLSYIDSVRDDADKIHKMQKAIDKSDNFWKVFNEFNENFNNYKSLYSKVIKKVENLNANIKENKKYFDEETEKINNFAQAEINKINNETKNINGEIDKLNNFIKTELNETNEKIENIHKNIKANIIKQIENIDLKINNLSESFNEKIKNIDFEFTAKINKLENSNKKLFFLSIFLPIASVLLIILLSYFKII